jgi:RND family efflux transporter MFP subunit
MMDAEKVSRLRIVQKEQIGVRSRRRWKYLLGALLLIAIAALSFILYEHGALSPVSSIQITSVAWVYPSQTITVINASGYIVPQRKASVASKGTGRLEYLGVMEGSKVKEGDVLARLDSDDLRAEQAQVEAQLAAARADLFRAETELRTAERNLKRYANLWEQQVVSESAFESAQDQFSRSRAFVDSGKANIKAIEANLKRLSVLIGYTVIRAPFDGVVLTKDADVGEVVAPFGSATSAKAAVVTMADLSSLMVQTDVAESFLSKVYEGQPCEVQLDALPDVRFPGKVATIVPTADRTRGTVMVKVRFDRIDPRILPEMSARVAFLSRPLEEHESKPFLAVHRDALTQREGVQGIFKTADELAQWVPLPSASLNGDYVPLTPPLQAGDQIVMKPAPSLENGSKIKVAE